jgi:hypothetical protein
MKLGLGTRLFHVRLFQAVLSLIVIAANGWLMEFIDNGALGLGANSH